MHGEFRPDLRGLFAQGESGVWVPQIDLATHLQQVYPVATRHVLLWPGDRSISLITERSWFSLTTGWTDDFEGDAKLSGHLWAVGANGNSTIDKAFSFAGPDRRFEFGQLPTGTVEVRVALDAHWNPVGWAWEKQGRVS